MAHRCWIYLAFGGLTGFVQAQPIEIAKDSANALPEVVVNARHYENRVGTSDAASEGAVNGQIFNDLPLLRPGEALETVPGMVVTQHSGDGKANQYFLRGYNLDHGSDFAVSIDGMPVNLPTHAHGQGYTDINHLIPELIDRIDYKKGPYFASSGDFSSAGSADIQYRNTIDKSSFSLTAGPWGYNRSLWLTSSAQNIDGKETDSIKPNWISAVEVLGENGPWVNPEKLRKFNGLLKLSDGSKDNGWSINLTGYKANWNSTDQVPLSLIQSGQLNRFGALDPTDGGYTSRLGASFQWNQNNGESYTKIKGWVQHYEMKLWSDFTYYAYRNPRLGCSEINNNLSQIGASIPAMGCVLAPNANSPTDQFLQFENRNFMGASIARGWTHEWLRHESIFELGSQIRYDNIHVGLADTQSRVNFNTVSSDVVGETSIGMYLQQIDYWKPWFRTVTGLRDDFVGMRLNSSVINQNSGSAKQSIIQPKFSMILGPWDKTEYFFNIGKGFHSNDARGVINKIDPTTFTSSTPVNALVASLGKEIGMRSEAIQDLQTSLSLWSLHSNSEIIYSADSSIGSTTPNGPSDRVGVEWNNRWSPNKWLSLDLDTSWIKAKYTYMNDNGQMGNDIPNAVNRVINARVTIHQGKLWSAGLEMRFIGAYPLSQDGSMIAPSSFIVNARYRQSLNDRMDVSLDVLNLLNRRYYDIAYQQDYQTCATCAYTANGQTVHPGEPRQTRVTLRYFY